MSDKTPVLNLDSRCQLDGSGEFKSQINALNRTQQKAEPDFTFSESTVKDVSDNGRMRAAAKIQEVLQQVIQTQTAPKTVAISGSASFGDVELPDAEVRGDVKKLLRRLEGVRLGGISATDTEEVVDALRQLEQLPITVTCLKATKIAIELNQPCWKNFGPSGEVRERASSLVRRWRTMYRAEGGTDTAMKATQVRHCRNLSMDLEDCAHAVMQKLGSYMEIINGVAGYLRGIDVTSHHSKPLVRNLSVRACLD